MAYNEYDDGNFYGDDDEEENVTLTLEPCNNCGRNFNVDVLPRHEKICAKIKKRKTFDSSKQRLEGLENLPKGKKDTPAKKEPPKKKPDWRRKHEEFVKTIRAARGVTAAIKQGKTPPPPPEPTYNPDYIQCQYCNRRFNETAAERHINFCKEQKSRIPKQSGDSKYDSKKEKQNKRTQYRPPLPGSKKKSESSPAGKRISSGSASTTNVKSSPMGGYNRETSSDTALVAKNKRNNARLDQDERPLNNSRYSKTSKIPSSDHETPGKPRSGKNKNGDPKWFEELKRGDSGNQIRKTNSKNRTLDELDSGMDLNDNYSGRGSGHRYGKEHPVGVVRPSSRSKESDDERSRNISAGRRQKMANFCHECGTKYPVPLAKFCCECGVRRMSLV